MKLLYLNGKFEGRSVPVNPPGLSIGREADNDVVVTEELASRYHAKITLDNGVWHVEDLGSSNGTFLNGAQLAGKSPLSIQDEIRIGQLRIQFADDNATFPAAAGKGNAAAAGAGGTGGRKSRTHVLGLALIVLMAIFAVAFALQIKKSGTHKPAVNVSDAATNAPLKFYYEVTTLNADSVYRYELGLTDGTLHIATDDLINMQHQTKDKVLTDEQIADLQSFLLTPEFLDLKPEPAMKSELGMARVRLMISKGNVGNYVDYLNLAIKPPIFTSIESELEDLGQKEFGVFRLTREERLEKARALFTVATQLQESRGVKESNLFDSIDAYNNVLILLEGLADPPDYYAEAFKQKQIVEHELDEMIKDYTVTAQIHTRAGKLQEAREQYEKIRELVPPNHPAHRAAKEAIIRLQRQIVNSNKKSH